MRISAFDVDGRSELFLEAGGGWASLGPIDLAQLIRSGDEGRRRLAEAAGRASADGAPPAGARLLAPLPRPGKLVFCGVNYLDHVAELPPEWKVTAEPFVFAKLPSSIIGPGDPIVIPQPERQVDYEVELAVVIGQRARNVPTELALAHVFGYTLINDVTARDIQATDNQLTMSKGIDTFCPMGPAVVLTDELPDPSRLELTTHVNGECRQRSTTDQMIFPVPELISRLSAYFTLEPGDLIATGTPAGIGASRKPPVFLAPGDRVTVAADAIGALTNPVVAGW